MSRILLIGLISTFCLSACQQQADRDEAIRLEIKQKLDEHFKYRFDACHDLLVKDVEAQVDSVLYLEIVLGLHGDVEIPARPDRAGDTIDYDVVLDTTRLNAKDLENFLSK
jgi:hypothetical protein